MNLAVLQRLFPPSFLGQNVSCCTNAKEQEKNIQNDQLRLSIIKKKENIFLNLNNFSHTCSNAVHAAYHTPSPKPQDNSKLICNSRNFKSSHFGTVHHGSFKVELILLKTYITVSYKLKSKVFDLQHQRITFKCDYSASENWLQTKKDDRTTSQKASTWSTLLLRKDMRRCVREAMRGHTLSYVHMVFFGGVSLVLILI